jgi:hypothetical protein
MRAEVGEEELVGGSDVPGLSWNLCTARSLVRWHLPSVKGQEMFSSLLVFFRRTVTTSPSTRLTFT